MMADRTVAFRTLGCRLNQCETAQMEESLAARGYRLVSWEEGAALRVLNTCTVTGKTDRECRRLVRKAKRRDPGTRVVVTGCYAQVAPDRVAEVEGVDLVLGNLDKASLGDHVDRILGTGAGGPDKAEGPPAARRGAERFVTEYVPGTCFQDEVVTHFSGYTRAFLKVQNGCDSRCSYCVIPRARGPSRSMRRESVLRQVGLLEEEGYREVVLTAIHLGAWGRDLQGDSLAALVRALCAETGVERFRLSSLEPMEMDDGLLNVLEEAGAEGRIAEHFHLPLQSGSDAVLRRMNRPYSSREYGDRVEEVRGRFPDAAIGADIIVGFPGETETEFRETLELADSLPLTYLHVFSYSDRPGTRAASMPSKVQPDYIRRRSSRLRALSEEKRREFEGGFVNRELRALTLRRQTAEGRRVALTGNYLEVLLPGDEVEENRMVPVRVTGRGPEGRWEAICGR